MNFKIKNLSKKIIKILLISSLLFSFNCGKKENLENKVRIGYMEHASGIAYFIADDKGYFKKEGLEVELVKCGFREHTDALISERVDLNVPTSFPYLFGIEAENPGTIKIFHLGGEKSNGELIFGFLVNKKSSIKSVEDLRQKKIGATSQIDILNLKLILSKLQLNLERDVKIIPVGLEVAAHTLTANRIDVLFISQPYLILTMAKGGARLLIKNPRANYIIDPYWSGASAVLTKYAKRNPKIVEKVMDALDEALDFYKENPIEGKKIVAKYVSYLSSELATEMGIYFKVKSTEPVDLEKVQYLADILVEYGILRKKIDVEKMYLSREKLEDYIKEQEIKNEKHSLNRTK
ncbi:MAG: ABC transporter substrate-binding protein [Candidatus Pacearchaeota archaeon]|nr:MAG: ABC transporter substrate-binding protein [Candidatus Pacearchaeota archaeon]